MPPIDFNIGFKIFQGEEYAEEMLTYLWQEMMDKYRY